MSYRIKYIVLALVVGVIGFVLWSNYSKKSSVSELLALTVKSSALPVKPLSIIVIDICSLRADHVGAYGYSRPTTPNLDAFSKQAVTFDNFWTQSGWCLPNFATMLTGTRPEVHNMNFVKSQISPSLKPLAEILTENGYATAGFSGSRYLVPKKYGLERGFQTFVNPYTSQKDHAHGAVSFEKNLPAIKTWLATNKDKPLFLYATIDDLHSPYTHADNPKQFDPNYTGTLDKITANLHFNRAYNGDLSLKPDAKLLADVTEFKKDPRHLTNLIARYDAGVVRVDRLVGELIEELKKNGLWDNALIIITAHQGEQLGEQGLLGHTIGIYEPVLSVPLFIRYPGATESNTRLTQLTERIDIPTTILDVAGILPKYKNQYTGTSLLPIFSNTTATTSWKQYIFASSKPPSIPAPIEPSIEERAVRNDQYKLIWHKYKKNQYELYDLKNDPSETVNLVNKLPAVFNELKTELDQYTQKNKQTGLPNI